MKNAGMLALILLSAAPVAARPGIVCGPWVNQSTPDSGIVVWAADGKTPGEVTWSAGTLTGRVTATVSAVHGRKERVDSARIAGLPPSTLVSYEARWAGEARKGSFTTEPPAGSREPFSFIVYGDTRSRVEKHRDVIRAMAGEPGVLFAVHTGDLVSNGRKWDQWPEQFFGPAEPLLEKAALWPVRGNHEGDAKLYLDLFDLPGNERWYSFDCGNLHVVVLDSEADDADQEAQVAWLRRDLAQSRAEWKLAAYHAPSFNVGGHGSHWGSTDVLPLLEEYGVDVVTAGHSHLYERFVPIGPPGRKPIIHIVTGGGGAPLYDAKPSPLLEGGIGRAETHYCVFGISGNRLTMTVKRPDGSVLDRMELVKTDGRFQPEVMSRAVSTSEARRLLKESKARAE